MLIVLEGLPGAGKTTTIRRLYEKKIAKVIPEIIDQLPQNEDESFYINNDRKKYALINEAGDARPTVMDRNFVSTLCYNYCSDRLFKTNNYEYIKKSIKKLMNDQLAWQPDLYIVLDCSIESSIARQDATNDSVWFDKQFLKTAQRFYEDYFKSQGCDYIIINSDDMAAGQIVDQVGEVIAQLSRKKGKIYV